MINFIEQWTIIWKYLEKFIFMDATEGNICSGIELYSFESFYLNVQGKDASADFQNGYDSC